MVTVSFSWKIEIESRSESFVVLVFGFNAIATEAALVVNCSNLYCADETLVIPTRLIYREAQTGKVKGEGS